MVVVEKPQTTKRKGVKQMARTWKMEAKYVRRRRVVFGLGVAVIAYAVWQVSGHLWWVGDHYCWGDMVSCYFPESGK